MLLARIRSNGVSGGLMKILLSRQFIGIPSHPTKLLNHGGNALLPLGIDICTNLSGPPLPKNGERGARKLV